MNEVIKRITTHFKNPKLLIALGICGIALLLFSSLLDTDGTKDTLSEDYDTAKQTEEYRAKLEEDVLRIVKSISGDKKATVVVTLESSIKYDYANSFDTTSSNSSGSNTKNESSSSSKTYLTFKNRDGGEEPLIITEIMPEVRGVAIVCYGGDDQVLTEKIKNAVTAALNITSKRVYIVGGSNYEKR